MILTPLIGRISPSRSIAACGKQIWTSAARHHFIAALADKFGNEGKAYAKSLADRRPEDVLRIPAQIARGKVTLHKNSAELIETSFKYTDLSDDYDLRRVDGKWKVINGVTPAVVEGAKERIEADAQLDIKLQQIADRTAKGQYATLAEARDAWQKLKPPPPIEFVPAQLRVKDGDPAATPKVPAVPEIETVMDQLAYESQMIQVSTASLGLTAAQTDSIAAAKTRYVKSIEDLQTQQPAEFKSLRADEQETQQIMLLVGGNADPVMIMHSREKHLAAYKLVLGKAREFRKSIEETLAPAQRIDWQADPLRTMMNKSLANLTLTDVEKQQIKPQSHQAASVVLKVSDRSYTTLKSASDDAVQRILNGGK